MKYARITKEDGSNYTDNYMLDQVLDTLNAFGISNEDEKNDDLIKRLTIEKIEYGRTCMNQLLSRGMQNIQGINSYWLKLDSALQVKINELRDNSTEKLLSK